jgi:hypothetical protein
MIEAADPERYKRLAADAGTEAARRLALYKHLSEWKAPVPAPATATSSSTGADPGGAAAAGEK